MQFFCFVFLQAVQAQLEGCKKYDHRTLKQLFSFSLLLSGAPDEPRQRAKAMLRPHQAPGHLGAVLRRQLQRYTKEIPEHGGVGLRLPLTSAFRWMVRLDRKSTHPVPTPHPQ